MQFLCQIAQGLSRVSDIDIAILFVCPSVRLSRSRIVSKRLIIILFQHTVA